MSQRHDQWRARPALATALRWTLLALPLVTSTLAVYGVSRALPPGAGRSWQGLALLLVVAVVVAVAFERAARRLLPIALLLRLSTIFPDRAPSRLKLARAAAVRSPKEQLLWHGTQARPTSTSGLVLDLVSALGTHDRRTRGHSERVRLLTDMLAVELKLDDEDRDRLRWSALLHDVGKMEISPSILNKPAGLDDREFARMREHPAAGALLCAPLLPWLGAWGEGIVDHHEKYDGSGYPSGKSGEEISLAGRVIGMIDAFETMTSARPYKKAMATRSAREELARCAGSHFDPALVRAFLTLSLPRVLWAMGPLSFLLQLPFLRPVAYAGSRGAVAAPQAAASLATGAAGAAGAAAIAAGGATAVPAAAPELPTRAPAASSQAQQAPADGSAAATAAPSPASAPAAASPAPSPVDLPSSSPVEQGVVGSRDKAADPAPDVPAEPVALPVAGPPAEQPQPGPSAPPTAEPEDPPVPEPTAGPTAGSEGEDEDREEPDSLPSPDPGHPAPSEPRADATAQPSAQPSGPPATPPSAEPTPVPSAQPAPAASGGDTSQANGPLLSGPPRTTSSREATFELAVVDGVAWECQILGNGAGESSAWQPCSRTWTLTVVKDGEHVVRVRDAATAEPAGSWTWTVEDSDSVSAQGAVDPVLLPGPLLDRVAAAPVVAPGLRPLTAALSLAAAALLPISIGLRRLRERRG